MFETVIEILEDSGYTVLNWEGTLDSLEILFDEPVNESDIEFALNESNYSGDITSYGDRVRITNIEEI